MKFLVWNLENCFIDFSLSSSFDYESFISGNLEYKAKSWPLKGRLHKNKELSKILQIAKIIEESCADILLLSEIGGQVSFENLNRLFLKNQYKIFSCRSNSLRGIDSGFLVRKELNMKYDFISHKEKEIDFSYPVSPQRKEKMSRDISELRVFSSGELKFVLLLVHLKSPYDPMGIDRWGQGRRAAEAKLLMDVYQQLREELNVPIMIGGDFNGSLQRACCDREFSDWYEKTDLEDVLEIKKLDLERRVTYCVVNRNKRLASKQLDYFFLPKEFSVFLEKAKVCFFKDSKTNKEYLLPQNREQRHRLPSDHYPLWIEMADNF